MKKKVLVAREVFAQVLDFLEPHFAVTANQEDRVFGAEELAQALADKEGALTTLTERIDEELLRRCPKLRAVCNIAVGYNNIDLAACDAHGVLATNTPGVLDDTTADFAWALILATARRLNEAEAYVREGRWDKWKLKQFMGLDVHHAVLGIVGLGRIGQAVAKRAVGFEMEVLYHDVRPAAPEIETACRARYADREELFSRADIVTIHIPYSRETHHAVGAAEIALMKNSAILIHAARGGVVDDGALVEALRKGAIAGAGLDVFEGEPAIHPGFLELKNVVVSPHIASSSEKTRLRMAMMAAENLVSALTSGKPPNLLNPAALGKSPRGQS
ncbi:MAG: D-glycerate dehydrogenase [Deltaproteobacteria bacterium]|nr:D-glycerate dehydrogenase [Deltaproteobacteria bacterium]